MAISGRPETRVEVRSTEQKQGPAYNVWLSVGVQHFQVGPTDWDDYDEALHFAEMLQNALAKMVAEHEHRI